jgi:transcriptional regulator with XRE-family HTH domain
MPRSVSWRETEACAPDAHAAAERASGRGPLAEQLRRLRTERRLTQQRLADRAGISKEAIHVYERGRKRPRASTLALLARALGVPPAELAGPSAESPADRPVPAA